ncbi:hypothetical protein FXO38_04044 [Capsicum annuum]|nr:hypothetical protein FXO38_04044 [Capsicum annuum]
MDDSEFDFGQLDQLFNFLSSSLSPPSPPTTLQNQDSSISLQTQNSNHVPKKKPIVTNHHHQVMKKKPIKITNINNDDQVQNPRKEKEMIAEKKKVLRRDVERQRRRDMAKLYQRLRLLIPSKYLMGKRSISDHLEQIVDYVKDLRKDIEDLERKREALKQLKSTICSSQLAPSSSSMKLNDDNEDRIIVKSCNEGVEICIKGELSLSKVLKVVMKEGFIVSSCVSSTVDQSLFHIIQSEDVLGSSSFWVCSQYRALRVSGSGGLNICDLELCSSLGIPIEDFGSRISLLSYKNVSSRFGKCEMTPTLVELSGLLHLPCMDKSMIRAWNHSGNRFLQGCGLKSNNRHLGCLNQSWISLDFLFTRFGSSDGFDCFWDKFHMTKEKWERKRLEVFTLALLGPSLSESKYEQFWKYATKLGVVTLKESLDNPGNTGPKLLPQYQGVFAGHATKFEWEKENFTAVPSQPGLSRRAPV